MRTPNRLLRRLVLLLVALLLLAPMSLRPGSAQQPSPDDLVVSGAALAGAGTAIGHVNPDFDFWPIFSSTRIDNDQSHGLSGAFWPGFLVDAFLFLYDVQEQGRAAMGVSETQWPNEPHEARASSSAFLLNNFVEGCRFFTEQLGGGGCEELEPIFRDPPGVVAHSSSVSGPLDGQGSARGTRFTVPGVFTAEEARSDTASTFEDGSSVVSSSFQARDLVIGSDLRVSQLVATSAAAAGSEPSADSTLQLGSVTFAGQEATIDDQGVHLTEDPASSAVNDALGAEGIEVRLVRGSEEVSDGGRAAGASSGGLLIRFGRERASQDIPESLREAYEQTCKAAEDSPINQEITSVRVEQDNPLFGTIPFLPMPRSVGAEQSVPPPTSCPFLNRTFEVAFVLGFTEASARAVELPPFADTLGGLAGPSAQAPPMEAPRSPGAASSDPLRNPGPTGERGEDGTDEVVTLAGGPQDRNNGFAGAVELVYIVLMIGLGLAVAGRFVLKEVSAP